MTHVIQHKQACYWTTLDDSPFPETKGWLDWARDQQVSVGDLVTIVHNDVVKSILLVHRLNTHASIPGWNIPIVLHDGKLDDIRNYWTREWDESLDSLDVWFASGRGVVKV